MAAILSGGALLLVIFSWLVVVLLRPLVGTPVMSMDEAVLRWVNRHVGGWLDVPAVEVTYLGSALVVGIILLVAALLLWIHRLRVATLFLVASLGGAALLSALLKELFGRARPNLSGPLTHVFEASFPSGHAIRSLALYAGLAWLVWRLDTSPVLRFLSAAGAGLLVLSIGASRVYLGVHFPSDVLAGYLLGAAWLVVCAVAARGAGGVARRANGAAPRVDGSTPMADGAPVARAAAASRTGREPTEVGAEEAAPGLGSDGDP